jgi:hypothetical protein
MLRVDAQAELAASSSVKSVGYNVGSVEEQAICSAVFPSEFVALASCEGFDSRRASTISTISSDVSDIGEWGMKKRCSGVFPR